MSQIVHEFDIDSHLFAGVLRLLIDQREWLIVAPDQAVL
jgi:hypothetical protein